MMANAKGEIFAAVEYTGKIIEAGNRTLPVATPKRKPATTQSVTGRRGIEAIRCATLDASNTFKNMNIPRIIKAKFHGFIFLEIFIRFNGNGLNLHDRKKAVLTPIIVAIS